MSPAKSEHTLTRSFLRPLSPDTRYRAIDITKVFEPTRAALS
jgi:hypothetical protein